jgi:hypothetical protein
VGCTQQQAGAGNGNGTAGDLQSGADALGNEIDNAKAADDDLSGTLDNQPAPVEGSDLVSLDFEVANASSAIQESADSLQDASLSDGISDPLLTDFSGMDAIIPVEIADLSP